MRSQQSLTTTKILAFLGGLALGFTALINAVIAAIALFTGNLFGAASEVAAEADAADHVTASIHHAATTAKVIAISFAVLAALEFAAGEFLRRRVRNVIVPIAAGVTVIAEVGFSVWRGRFTGLDAILIGCAGFAMWAWWRMPAIRENDQQTW